MTAVTLPLNVFAVPLGTVNMKINYSTPIVNVNGTNYYGDYDAVLNTDASGIFDNGFYGEVFCTENADLRENPTDYDIYKIQGINSDLEDGQNIDLEAMLAEATWYANWFLNNQNDDNKGLAQYAIWHAIGWANSTNDLYDDYLAADDQNAYISDWYLAVSPGDGGAINIGEIGQNYLIKAPAPVPEPATIVLLATGLLGALGFRKRQK